jgi:hypothetical protein
MSSDIMQKFLSLGKNFQNHKKEIYGNEEKEKFLNNIQISITHLQNIESSTEKILILNKISKLLFSNNKDLNDPYYIYLKNLYEIQKKVKIQLKDDSNLNSPFSNKIYKYFQSENKLEDNNQKIKKTNHQKRKPLNDINLKQKNLLDYFPKNPK